MTEPYASSGSEMCEDKDLIIRLILEYAHNPKLRPESIASGIKEISGAIENILDKLCADDDREIGRRC